jgi:protein-tyrosine phosphatase
VELAGQSRKLSAADLRRFDYVVAMDGENLREIRALEAAAGGGARIHRLREWDSEPGTDVPDPYYGGPSGFDDVHDIVDRSCEALLDHVLAERRD